MKTIFEKANFNSIIKMIENIKYYFIRELSKFGNKPKKLNDDKETLLLTVGEKYTLMGYSPRPGFYGDCYVIYCKKTCGKYEFINSFYSNTKINEKIIEYRKELADETPIIKKKDKELYAMDPPIEFTLGEIKNFLSKGKNIKYREIFFK